MHSQIIRAQSLWCVCSHYSDIVMSTMASQITGILIVCSTILFRCTSKFCVTGLCEGSHFQNQCWLIIIDHISITFSSQFKYFPSIERNSKTLFGKWQQKSTNVLTRQIWGIWKLRPAYSPETPNLGQNRWCFVPCDLENWWMTLENNRASFLCCFKLSATFHSHRWIQTGVTVRKRPIWVKFDDF